MHKNKTLHFFLFQKLFYQFGLIILSRAAALIVAAAEAVVVVVAEVVSGRRKRCSLGSTL